MSSVADEVELIWCGELKAMPKRPCTATKLSFDRETLSDNSPSPRLVMEANREDMKTS